MGLPKILIDQLSIKQKANTSITTSGGQTISGNLTVNGTLSSTTASKTTNSTQVATTAFVKTAVSDLVSSAPETLDTLNELASALGNDANFATTVSTNIGNKADKSTTLSGYGITDAKIESGTITLGSETITPLTSVPEATASSLGGIKYSVVTELPDSPESDVFYFVTES